VRKIFRETKSHGSAHNTTRDAGAAPQISANTFYHGNDRTYSRRWYSQATSFQLQAPEKGNITARAQRDEIEKKNAELETQAQSCRSTTLHNKQNKRSRPAIWI